MNIELNELVSLLGTNHRPKQPITGPQQIVVIDRGWVMVGNSRWVDGGIQIDSARCIRIWGTTRGIGQLAESGPTEQTKLDPCGSVFAPDHAVILVIPCKSNW